MLKIRGVQKNQVQNIGGENAMNETQITQNDIAENNGFNENVQETFESKVNVFETDAYDQNGFK